MFYLVGKLVYGRHNNSVICTGILHFVVGKIGGSGIVTPLKLWRDLGLHLLLLFCSFRLNIVQCYFYLFIYLFILGCLGGGGCGWGWGRVVIIYLILLTI